MVKTPSMSLISSPFTRTCITTTDYVTPLPAKQLRLQKVRATYNMQYIIYTIYCMMYYICKQKLTHNIQHTLHTRTVQCGCTSKNAERRLAQAGGLWCTVALDERS